MELIAYCPVQIQLYKYRSVYIEAYITCLLFLLGIYDVYAAEALSVNVNSRPTYECGHLVHRWDSYPHSWITPSISRVSIGVVKHSTELF